MWRHARLTMRGWGNASDEVLSILDVKISGFVLLVGHDLPSEKAGIELAGALCIRRAQIGPAKCAGDMCDSNAGILRGLPHAEMRTGRILDHGHASQIHHVEGRRDHGTTELFGLGSGLISAIHGD